MVGNHAKSARVEGSLTARRTSRAGAKAGPSDPAVESGIAVAQRIKGTPGITGLSPPRVHIDVAVWHLDVGSSHPGAVGGGGFSICTVPSNIHVILFRFFYHIFVEVR